MKRRLIGVAAVVAGWVGAAGAVGAEASKPNVIVIVADDLGYADVGAQGISKDVKTPHVDSIAQSGVRFTSGYVTCPVCSPSRAGLLTGTYQTRFGYEMNPGGQNFPNFGLPVGQASLAEVMKGAGYRTGMVGKWHLGNKNEQSPTARGFDEFYGFWGGLHSYTQQTPGFNMVRRGLEKAEKVDYLTDELGREAAAFVEKHHEKPFFLYMAFNAVHSPLQAPEKYLKRFEGVGDRKRKLMLAMLSAMDDAVGGVLGKLREHKIEENTLVFFITDNGGPTDGNASSNAPLSGYKAQLFEGGIRVPFFVQWKGKIGGGRVMDRPVSTLDIFATSVAVAGGEWPKERVRDGVDLMPWLAGGKEGEVHERLYWRYGVQWAVREGDWKVMGLKDRAKLFNLKEDIGEKKDLAKEKPEVLARLRGAYAKWDAEQAKPMWADQNWKMDDIEFDRQESPFVGRAERGGKTGGEE